MVKCAEISKAALIHTLPLNPFAKIFKQILSISGTVFPVLFIFHNVIPNKPISRSEGHIDSVGSLCLQGLMDRIDVLD